ncbi:hypothetical protein HK096_011449, partial [Nowakowskiella sp. JEL0078]
GDSISVSNTTVLDLMRSYNNEKRLRKILNVVYAAVRWKLLCQKNAKKIQSTNIPIKFQKSKLETKQHLNSFASKLKVAAENQGRVIFPEVPHSRPKSAKNASSYVKLKNNLIPSNENIGSSSSSNFLTKTTNSHTQYVKLHQLGSSSCRLSSLEMENLASENEFKTSLVPVLQKEPKYGTLCKNLAEIESLSKSRRSSFPNDSSEIFRDKNIAVNIKHGSKTVVKTNVTAEKGDIKELIPNLKSKDFDNRSKMNSVKNSREILPETEKSLQKKTSRTNTNKNLIK